MTTSRSFRCKAILFDLDGVLVDSAECVERTWRDWATHQPPVTRSGPHELEGRLERTTVGTLSALDARDVSKSPQCTLRCEGARSTVGRKEWTSLASS